MNEQSTNSRLSRRRILASTALSGLTATSGGCIRRARSIFRRDSPDQISLTITCVPAEEDLFPVEIVDHFRNNLEAAGIGTKVNYRSYEEFRFDVLLNHEYDVAVGRLPLYPDPDAFYGLFHSSFVPERGWQNPYGFANLELDEQLEEQRTAPEQQRRGHVANILEIIASEQPISPLVFPIEHRLVRSDSYEGFDGREFKYSADVLALDPRERRDTIEFGIGFTAPTRNLNPLSVEHRTGKIATGLVYDSLVLREGGEYHSWLADTVDWTGNGAVVTLREAQWHDGEPVTGEDVVFTYRLLDDTLLAGADSQAPAPVFRGRSTLVEDVVARDEREVKFEFTARKNVAQRALTVPVLPAHVWRERTETADVRGIESGPQITEATVATNIPPVGSGPYRFVDRSQRDYVALELVEDHFSTRVDTLSEFQPPAREMRIVVSPSPTGAVENVIGSELDVTLSAIPPEYMIEPDGEAAVSRTISRNPYHVGYNTRREPLSNASFRRVISMLIDKAWIASEVFDGEAVPTATPIRDDEWVPASLGWRGSDPEVPFLGNDGRIDLRAVKKAFLDIGYQYDEAENLIGA